MDAMKPGLSRRQILLGLGSTRDQGGPLPVIGPSCLPALGVVCQTCGDACPEQAIAFWPRLGLPPEPSIVSDRCTSCGICAEVCPVGAVEFTDQSRLRHA